MHVRLNLVLFVLAMLAACASPGEPSDFSVAPGSRAEPQAAKVVESTAQNGQRSEPATSAVQGLSFATSECANAGDGFYCGASTQGGFGGGNANTLYECSGGATVNSIVCGSQCIIAPPGSNDRCSPDPCHSAGDGAYCGSSTQGGFSPQYAVSQFLYHCTRGFTASVFDCGDGCTVAQPGQRDACTALQGNCSKGQIATCTSSGAPGCTGRATSTTSGCQHADCTAARRAACRMVPDTGTDGSRCAINGKCRYL